MQRHKEELKKTLLEVNEVMKGLKMEYFLLHGTLLGYYRDKDIILWDDDIDLGCLLDSSDTEIRNIIVIAFENRGYKSWIKETNEWPGACNIVFTKNYGEGDLSIAFKFIHRIADRAIEASSPVTYPINSILRLEQVTWFKEKFLIPSKPEELFDIWYGKDCWKIPSRRAWILKPRDRGKWSDPIMLYEDQKMGYRRSGLIEALLQCDLNGEFIKPYVKVGQTPRGQI